MKIPIHSDIELEKIAEEFLKNRAFGHTDGRSIRIRHVIEACCGYYIWSVPKLAELADAYVPIEGKRIFLDEDQDMNPVSFRASFTLAEELAHIILHLPLFQGKSPEEVVAMQSEITDVQYVAIEREAKYLAGSLLMPFATFQERFIHFHNIQSQRSSNQRNVLRFAIRELSRDFNVSCYAAAIRALHLKLIDQQQLDDLIEAYNW